MRNLLKNTKGFTLMEMLVAVALMAVVIGLGYNLYFQLNSAHKQAELKWNAQTKATQAAEFISKELSGAYSLDINKKSTLGKNEKSIYLKNGYLIYKDKETNTEKNISDWKFNITFDRAKDDDGKELNNVLYYSIQALDEENNEIYEVNSNIYLANMPENAGITGTKGSSVVYSKDASVTGVSIPDIDTYCFIATAAYGSEFEPSVVLLREFRDKCLMTNTPGRALVNVYYKYSPSVAELIEDKPVLKAITVILLIPFVGIAFILTSMNPVFSIIMIIVLTYLIQKIRMRVRA